MPVRTAQLGPDDICHGRLSPSLARPWRLIISPSQDAYMNMALDEALARAKDDTIPILRIYTWKRPSISIGYIQKVSHVLATVGLEEGQIDLVRRPTGGGAVLHDGGPSFCLVLRDSSRFSSKTITSIYALLGRCIVEGLKCLDVPSSLWEGVPQKNSHFCTDSLSPYDVVSNGRKVAGYSARRFLEVSLFQGFVNLSTSGGGVTALELMEAMIKGLEKAAGVGLMEDTISKEESALALGLRENKYTSRDWNYKR